MKNTVVIKGSQSGITLNLDDKIDFEKLKGEIEKKFKESSKFLGEADMAIKFKGRDLSESEIKDILEIISSNTKLNIVCVMSEDDTDTLIKVKEIGKNIEASVKRKAKDIETQYNKKREEDLKEDAKKLEIAKTELTKTLTEKITLQLKEEEAERKRKMPSIFHKGSVRSGQVLEMETSVIIIGDVNYGATVSAKGNVIVIGTLFGTVHAGSDGNSDAFVIAFDMSPNQIRIGDVIARSSDATKPVKGKQIIDPKVAYVDDGNIYIEKINRSVVKDLKISYKY